MVFLGYTFKSYNGVLARYNLKNKKPIYGWTINGFKL
jgi:hypothetical protein